MTRYGPNAPDPHHDPHEDPHDLNPPEHDPSRPGPIELSALGWDGSLADARVPGLVPGRVVRVDRAGVDLLTSAGPQRAALAGSLLAAAAADPLVSPCVGDWVALAPAVGPQDGRATVEQVLPRRTAFVRAAVTPGASYGQVLAANVDVAAVVEGLLPEPDLGRIERLLALAWDSGATPVVVLTKADLVRDADEVRRDVADAAPGADVLVVSAATGDGMPALAALLDRGRTLALIGPSGAGKSTLANALIGAEQMPTRALRADGKGRHTTVHRELLSLPGGGLVIDTPGLRSVGLTEIPAALGRVFAEIEQLAAECRFADCAHEQEPGCAVLSAVDGGRLAERRLLSWRKLQREAHWMALRQDARLRAQERASWRRRSTELRRSMRVRS